MNRRYKGVTPVTFMTLPHVGEVGPGAVLTGAAAEAVVGRTDFELVDEFGNLIEPDEPSEPAADVDVEVAAESGADAVEPASPAKPRRSASKADASV